MVGHTGSLSQRHPRQQGGQRCCDCDSLCRHHLVGIRDVCVDWDIWIGGANPKAQATAEAVLAAVTGRR